MKYAHGVDDKVKDRVWIWTNRVGTALLVALILGLCYFLLLLATDEPLDFVSIFIVVLALGIATCGLLDSTWRNGQYKISKDGLWVKDALFSRTIKWEDVTCWDVFPIRTVNFGRERDYIVFFLADRRHSLHKNLTFLSIHRKDFFIIRSTPERIEELSCIDELRHGRLPGPRDPEQLIP